MARRTAGLTLFPAYALPRCICQRRPRRLVDHYAELMLDVKMQLLDCDQKVTESDTVPRNDSFIGPPTKEVGCITVS